MRETRAELITRPSRTAYRHSPSLTSEACTAAELLRPNAVAPATLPLPLPTPRASPWGHVRTGGGGSP